MYSSSRIAVTEGLFKPLPRTQNKMRKEKILR